jgi:hypothetical protein
MVKGGILAVFRVSPALRHLINLWIVCQILVTFILQRIPHFLCVRFLRERRMHAIFPHKDLRPLLRYGS